MIDNRQIGLLRSDYERIHRETQQEIAAIRLRLVVETNAAIRSYLRQKEEKLLSYLNCK